MRILLVGAGGVGDAAARIAVERDFFAQLVVADHDLAHGPTHVLNAVDPRFVMPIFRGGKGAGVMGPEAFDAVPFLDLLKAPKPRGLGSPWGAEER